MPLHPQAQAVVDKITAMNLPPLSAVTPEEARAMFIRSRGPLRAPPQEVASALDRNVPGPGGDIPVRVYRPLGSDASALLPALMYFHGGGWVLGDLDTHDGLCRSVANAAGCAVVAVHYRRAPESKFPAAVNDALAVTRFLAASGAQLGVDGTRLAAGGDSAGGNLTAVLALALREARGATLQLQVLIYPVTDFQMNTASYTTLGKGYLLTHERMTFFKNAYLRSEADVADWRASPSQAKDCSHLPRALVITASHDPLVDEGKAYADHLMQSGVAVTYTCYPGMVHGFITMDGAISAANDAIKQIGAALRTAFE
jgi:acetyl esterase